MKGLILTYAIAAFACVGSFAYPLIGLFVYCGFAVLRPQSIFAFAGDIVGVSYWVALATIVGWVFNGMGRWRFGRGRAIVTALLLYSTWFIISSVSAINPSLAWGSFVNLVKYVLPFVIGVTLLSRAKDRRIMFWTLVLCMGYVGFEMNLNYAIKDFNGAAMGFAGMDNNCFGAALVSMVGPALALTMTSKGWRRIVALTALLLIIHTTLLTFSRGAMVGLVAVGVMAFILLPKRPSYLAAMLLVLVVVVRFTGPQLYARYTSSFAGADNLDGSSQSRLDLWRDCLEVVADYPLLGIGPANWRSIASTYGWSEGKSAHSVWMETAAETGVPGVLFLLSFFGFAIIKLMPIARERLTDENRDDVGVAIGVVLSATGFVVAGQFVSVTGLEAPYYVTMVGVAVLAARTDAVATVAATVNRATNLAARPTFAGLVRPAPASREAGRTGAPILDLSARRRPVSRS